MRICYIAKHGSGHNQDEDAITYALRRLGHHVMRVQESAGRAALSRSAELYLFHKWFDPETVQELRHRGVVAFWYFDLVSWGHDDPELASRNRQRTSWMCQMLPHVDLGFCTDGDWVAQDRTGKLVWLPQGFDSRLKAVPRREETIDLFSPCVVRGAGRERLAWHDHLAERYGDRFECRWNAYREELAEVIAQAKIVVAPAAPVTDRYCSNRLYWVLGLGGFLLHPYSVSLVRQFADGELVMYDTLTHLDYLIDAWLQHPRKRREFAERGRARVLSEHTYLHRCQTLIETVKARCL